MKNRIPQTWFDNPTIGVEKLAASSTMAPANLEFYSPLGDRSPGGLFFRRTHVVDTSTHQASI